jgi:hypothetical protein
MSTSSAYPFRHPRLRVVREPIGKERHWNPLRYLRRRKGRSQNLVSGWRDEAVLRSVTRLG